MAERSYPMSEVKGSPREELPPCLRPGAAARRSYPMPEVRAAAERSNPTSKEQRLHGRRGANRSYSTFKVRRGNSSNVRSTRCTLLEQP